jgi:hypothetical protein
MSASSSARVDPLSPHDHDPTHCTLAPFRALVLAQAATAAASLTTAPRTAQSSSMNTAAAASQPSPQQLSAATAASIEQRVQQKMQERALQRARMLAASGVANAGLLTGDLPANADRVETDVSTPLPNAAATSSTPGTLPQRSENASPSHIHAAVDVAALRAEARITQARNAARVEQRVSELTSLGRSAADPSDHTRIGTLIDSDSAAAAAATTTQSFQSGIRVDSHSAAATDQSSPVLSPQHRRMRATQARVAESLASPRHCTAPMTTPAVRVSVSAFVSASASADDAEGGARSGDALTASSASATAAETTFASASANTSASPSTTTIGSTTAAGSTLGSAAASTLTSADDALLLSPRALFASRQLARHAELVASQQHHSQQRKLATATAASPLASSSPSSVPSASSLSSPSVHETNASFSPAPSAPVLTDADDDDARHALRIRALVASFAQQHDDTQTRITQVEKTHSSERLGQ